MNLKRIIPAVLIFAGVCGALRWAATSSPDKASPSEVAVQPRSLPRHLKPPINPGTAAGAVAQLEGNASFSKVPPPRPTDDELNKLLQIHENSTQQ